MIRYMRGGMCVVAGCVNPRFQQSLIPHLRTMSIKLSDRLRRQAMAWFAGVCIISLCGGAALSGCGTIHGYGGVEHSFGYDFDDYEPHHHHHHHHKDYKKYRKEQKKRYKAYKKHQKKMAKAYKKHHKKHHHDDD